MIEEDRHTGKVVAEETVSLDGCVAGPNESGSEQLFASFAGGGIEFPSSDPDFKVRLTVPDHRYMRDVVESIRGHEAARSHVRRASEIAHGVRASR